MEDNIKVNELRALTWIDPVTTEVIKPAITKEDVTSTSRRLLLEKKDGNVRRMLKEKKKKSHIHGTNGYMLPLHSTSELLGIAHFHRPEGRETSDYARHGHHYSEFLYEVLQHLFMTYCANLIRFSNALVFVLYYSFMHSTCILYTPILFHKRRILPQTSIQ